MYVCGSLGTGFLVGKRENNRLGGGGEEAGEGPRTSPFPAISSLLLFG